MDGPVVLVGRSDVGAAITRVAPDASNVEAPVYVAGFHSDEGERALANCSLFPAVKRGPDTTVATEYEGARCAFWRDLRRGR
ncbi:hypothetical protein [Streptacidiphilus rugosus]|uniref:hypothetical protein n=1 Tax=Streptacidiphilus rugosus TaxID=405783 RepID=UPI000566716E|nr:hypothetical protein [Streptacidiphilus rugosus]